MDEYTPDMFGGEPPKKPKKPESNVEKGRRLRDLGMERATKHADEVVAAWRERAYGYLLLYAAGNATLTSERVRVFAENHGFPVPPDSRAWGSVMRRGAIARQIEKIGHAIAEDPKVHRQEITLWASRIVEPTTGSK